MSMSNEGMEKSGKVFKILSLKRTIEGRLGGPVG